MIPAIEGKMILDDRPLSTMFELEIPSAIGHELIRRLQAGAYKYGEAWTEVDLKTDLVEELMDSLNYVVLMAHRLKGADENSPYLDVVLGQLADILTEALDVARVLPDFVGPTSKEWVEARGSMAEAQARFQASLRGEG